MNFSDLLKACAYKLLPYVICIFVGLIVGGFVVYDHMAPKINEANAQLTAINNKYNIQIYFSPYNSYCKVSTYVKDNSIIELSFILDRAFFKIAYIKSTNEITITQYSISDVTNSISDDNVNAISSGAVYNLKTDLESKISSIKSYVDGLVGDINTVLESIITG